MRVVLMLASRAWTGSGVSFARLARRLGERGHTVTVIARLPSMVEALKAEGVEALARGRVLPSVSVRRAFARLEPDVVVADMKRDVLQAVRARRTQGFPILYRYNVLSGLLRASRLEQRRIAGADGLIFQSRELERRVRLGLPWLARIPGHVIHAGYDAAEFAVDPVARASFRARHGVPQGAPLVVSNSEVNLVKGSDLVIRAVALANARVAAPASIVMLGRPSRGADMVRLAAQLGVTLRLAGHVSRDESLAGCAAADVVVHPSREEIFPNAVVDAMGVGAPVLVSAAGGLPELVGPSGEAGIVVPPGELEPLAIALQDVLTTPGLRTRLGNAARARLARDFPVSRMQDGYEAAFRSARASIEVRTVPPP
jgi:glycosyltransferase involved in cell wall biosynthesis